MASLAQRETQEEWNEMSVEEFLDAAEEARQTWHSNHENRNWVDEAFGVQ
jgi:hypothetical protein